MLRPILVLSAVTLAFGCAASSEVTPSSNNAQAISAGGPADAGGGARHGGFGRRGHRRGPPPQAIEACASSVEGAACSFERRDGEATNGTCMAHPGVEGLSCVPERHEPGAREGRGAGRGQHRRGPPPEMLAACADQSEGAACSFARRNGETMNGTCMTHPRMEGLGCVPEGFEPGARSGRRGGRRGPPPQAVEACASLADGGACSFAGRDGEAVTGTCMSHPRVEGLSCVPEGMRERFERGRARAEGRERGEGRRGRGPGAPDRETDER